MKRKISIIFAAIMCITMLTTCASTRTDSGRPRTTSVDEFDLERKTVRLNNGIVLNAWFPLGGRGNTQTIFSNEVIAAIAEAHGKTSVYSILN